jgi:spore maturation protein CgeB
VNAPFINGFSPKLLECYAAGGFLLTTRKRDIATAFGGLADAIGYSSADELTAKIDYYLTHDSERRSVTRDMQEIIRHNYTASALFARTLPVAVESLRARRT